MAVLLVRQEGRIGSQSVMIPRKARPGVNKPGTGAWSSLGGRGLPGLGWHVCGRVGIDRRFGVVGRSCSGLPDRSRLMAQYSIGRCRCPPPPGSERAVADDRGGTGGAGRTRKNISNSWRSIDGPSGQVKPSRIRRAAALDDPGRHGGGRRPGPEPGEGGGLLGRRARPAAAGPDPGSPRRVPRAPRPGRRLDPRRSAHVREHRAVGRARPRVPVLEDHLARLAARPAIRFPRRAEGPGLGLQPRRRPSPGTAGSRSACTTTGGSSSRSRASARSGCSTSRSHPDIFWQLDVYWAQTAGADPAAVLAELGPRIGSLHLEGRARRPRPADDGARARGRSISRGVLRALTHPVDWVIELDECATDPLEAARESLAFLESLRVQPR